MNKPQCHGAKWSDEQDIWLLNAIIKNSIEMCAERMGRTQGSITSRLFKMAYEMYQKGESVDSIKCKFPPLNKQIEQYIREQELPNYHAEWDQSQDEWITKYVKQKGVSFCADKMGRCTKEISNRINYLIMIDINNGMSVQELYHKFGVNEHEISKMANAKNNVVPLMDADSLNEQGPYYVVLKGHYPGIFTTWEECRISICKYNGSKFKKCNTKIEVLEYINTDKVTRKTRKVEANVEEETQYYLNEEQSKIITDIMKNNKNVVILGSAGTGKSTVVKEIIKECNKNNVNIGITATTGCAAILIGGSTLHSFMGIGTAQEEPQHLVNNILSKKNILLKLYKLQILLIDEISMMNAEMFTKVSNVLSIIRNNSKPFGGIQVIMVGDFYQLPPVTGEFCFKSEIWKDMDFNIHQLTKIYRQSDMYFQELLERAKQSIITQEDIEVLKKCKYHKFSNDISPTRLYALNVNVKTINDIEYSKLNTTEKEYKTIYKNKKSQQYASKYQIEDTLKLRIGAQVMVTKNIDFDNNIINGTRGVVVSMSDANVTIKLTNHNNYTIGWSKINSADDDSIQIEYIPIKLAWAITIHKSQGVTLDCAEIDLGDDIFQCGQAYTALSRVKDLNSVRIVNLCKNSFKTHSDVHSFYKHIKI